MALFVETKGQGPDVVLLHGGLDNHMFLSSIQVQLLNMHFRVTWLDTPGIGESDWVDSIDTIEDMAETFMNVMPEKAVYIGWSFGGMLALTIAAKHPERVRHVIGITSTPRFLQGTDWAGMTGFYDAIYPTIEAGGLSVFLNDFVENEFAGLENAAEQIKKVKSFFQANHSVNLQAVSKRIKMVDETDLRSALQQLHCPVDFILGEQDETIPTAQYEKIKQLNPNVNLHIIKQAKHMVFQTHPDAFYRVLSQILSRWCARHS